MKIPPNPSPSPIFFSSFYQLLRLASLSFLLVVLSTGPYLEFCGPTKHCLGPTQHNCLGAYRLAPLLLYIILLYKYIYTLLNTVCFLCCDHSLFIRHRPTGGDLGGWGDAPTENNLRWGDGPCIRPPNILRSSVCRMRAKARTE